jgi:hypothetical protein
MLATSEIRSEIERLSKQIEEWEKERARIDELINPAKRERESWQFIYSRRAADPERATAKTQEEAALTSTENVDQYGAKSRVMRQHILNSHELGVTPKSVQDYMRLQNLPVSANFVYKTLAKMREEGEIKSEGGVFRPVRE